MAKHDVEDILRKWHGSRSELVRVRGDHQLNNAYYEGYQAATYLISQESLVYSSSVETNRVESRHNRFRSNIEVLLGKWTQSELEFQVPAASADDLAVQSARVAQHVLDYARIEQDWESLRHGTLSDTLMGGTALVTVDWDPDADSLSIDPKTGTPSDTGEIRLRSFSIDEFTLSPGARSPEQARWLLTGQALEPELIQEWYNLIEPPSADASGLMAPGFYRSTAGQGRSGEDLALLLIYYEPPSRKSKGRIVHASGGEVIHSEKWPYPFQRIPGYVFRASFNSSRWWASSFISEARPLQRRYNQARTKIAEHVDYASAPKLLAAYGTFVNGIDSMTDIAGEILEYHPDPDGQLPVYLQPPPAPRVTQFELETLMGEIDDIMHVHDISRGKAPGDRNSGTALAILAEQDETPLGMLAQDQARGWSRIGEMIVGLYAKHATGTRDAVYRPGPNMPTLRRAWNGKMLEGVRRVHVPLESTRPISKAARQERIVTMAERFPSFAEAMTPGTLAKMFDLPADDAESVIAPDVQSALYENALMLAGEVPLPKTWEDHAAHMAQHNALRAMPAYRHAPDEIQSLIDDHITAHQRLQEEELAQQQALNTVQPGLAAMPQANAPIGAATVPPAPMGGMI